MKKCNCDQPLSQPPTSQCGNTERDEHIILTTPANIEWLLSLPEEIKLDALEDYLKQDMFVQFMIIAKVLLDTPIQSGGISTEKIEAIRKKYF